MNHFDQNDSATTPNVGRIIAWIERVTRRSLGDVRIHDSEQAGQLVRRLGARAFAAGRDIYVRPELLKPLTRDSAALLAHELYHVAEQSGEVAAPEATMPLLRPSLHTQSRTAYPISGQAVSAPPTDSATSVGPISVQRQPGSGLAVQRATSAGLSGSETAAEGVEGAVSQQPHGKAKKPKQTPPDPELIAELVYRHIVQELLLDRERGAYYG